jgi:drug/metabolite transporter (DMT)-like permease
MKGNAGASRRLKADLALVGVTIIWGATFILVKEALNGVSTMLFLTMRFGIAALALWFTFRGRGSHYPRNRKRELLIGMVVGTCLFSGYTLQTAGLRYTSASKAGFITGFYIVLVPVLGAAIYRRMPQASEAAGVLLATVGMGLMTLNSLRFDIAYGDLLVLGCSFAYALHILLLGHFSRHMSYESLAVNQIGTGALLGGLTFWWMETPRLTWTPSVIAALAVTSLLATALAFSIQSWAQQFTTPTRTALIFSLEPVFAWLTSFLVAGELLTVRSAFGALLILGGILCVELKPIRFGAHPPTT